MVVETLKILDSWYKEPSVGGDQPKLVSKMATLELCGWIEEEFDRLVLEVAKGRLNDSDWLKKKVLDVANGFQYENHFRRMLCAIIGEIFARRIEEKMNEKHPGECDQLRSMLGELWKTRCNLAHADIEANVAAQQTFNAPSWAINQHGILAAIIGHYETVMLEVIAGI